MPLHHSAQSLMSKMTTYNSGMIQPENLKKPEQPENPKEKRSFP